MLLRALESRSRNSPAWAQCRRPMLAKETAGLTPPSPSARADLDTSPDEDGVVHFTHVPPRGRRGVRVAVAARKDAVLRLVSQSQKNLVELSLAEVRPVQGTDGWVNYPLGMLAVLREEGLRPAHGFDLAVTNDLPIGAGLSSSAAIELATVSGRSRLEEGTRWAASKLGPARRQIEG